jgi:hypothetical protein
MPAGRMTAAHCPAGIRHIPLTARNETYPNFRCLWKEPRFPVMADSVAKVPNCPVLSERMDFKMG